jgi:sec-independent protein translocase protein TatA
MLLANLFLSSLGPGEILLIGLVVLLMFGGKKIPELMKGLGQGIREFNKAKNNIESEVKESMREIEK